MISIRKFVPDDQEATCSLYMDNFKASYTLETAIEEVVDLTRYFISNRATDMLDITAIYLNKNDKRYNFWGCC